MIDIKALSFCFERTKEFIFLDVYLLFTDPFSTGQNGTDGKSESPERVGSPFSHNLTFPYNATTSSSPGHHRKDKTARERICGVFSVDLGNFLRYIHL